MNSGGIAPSCLPVPRVVLWAAEAKRSTWEEELHPGWRSEFRDRVSGFQEIKPSNPPKPASPLTVSPSETWTPDLAVRSSSIRPSVPLKPNSFSSLRQARASCSARQNAALPALGPAHLRLRAQGWVLSPEYKVPKLRGASLTSLRRSGPPPSLGIGYCGSRRIQAARRSASGGSGAPDGLWALASCGT